MSFPRQYDMRAHESGLTGVTVFQFVRIYSEDSLR